MVKKFTIRELAEEFEITTRALRFYEEKGLLKPTRHKQMRSYSAADRTRLKLILRGKRLGLSLEESSDIIQMYDPSSKNTKQIQALIKSVQSKREQLLQQQQDIKLMLIDLDSVEARCISDLQQTSKQLTT